MKGDTVLFVFRVKLLKQYLSCRFKLFHGLFIFAEFICSCCRIGFDKPYVPSQIIAYTFKLLSDYLILRIILLGLSCNDNADFLTASENAAL